MRPRPVVAVSVCLDPGLRWRAGHDYLYVHRAYGRALAAAGAAPLLWGPDTPVEALDRVDAVVVTGGDDVPPGRYGQAPALPLDLEVEERVEADLRLLAACEARGVPVLAVCYGMQLLNVHRGGTLVQDLPTQRPSAVDHGSAAAPTDHPVTAVRGSRLALALGASPVRVRSAHHQAVLDLGRGLACAATAEDGLVEAVEGEGPWWVLGVEWHPEQDGTGAPVYAALVEAARTRSAPSGRPGGTG